ncbi:MAG: hypothetical protein ABH872_01545 [Candidatus Omnitrophota bacterium]
MMKGVCSIAIDSDVVSLCFASLRGPKISLLDKEHYSLSSPKGVIELFKNNGFRIAGCIKEKENKHRLKFEKTFLCLSPSHLSSGFVEETVCLPKRREISSKDIFYAKGEIEEKVLGWDDLCIHSCISNFTVNKTVYYSPPAGVLADRIKLRLYLVWIKQKDYHDICNILDEYHLKLDGIVVHTLAAFSSVLKNNLDNLAIINIRFYESDIVMVRNGRINNVMSIDFGLEHVLEIIKGKFSLELDLAKELFERYVNFSYEPNNANSLDKEIVMRQDYGYIKISIRSLNSLVCNYVERRIREIFDKVCSMAESSEYQIHFTGRLNSQDGFEKFSHELISDSIYKIFADRGSSLAVGCLNYAVFKTFEKIRIKRHSFADRVAIVLRDYF